MCKYSQILEMAGRELGYFDNIQEREMRFSCDIYIYVITIDK